MNLSSEINEIDQIRTDNIIKIGLSKNVEGFRRGCHYISKEGLYINMDKTNIDEIIKEGMQEIESLVGDRKDYFICIDGVKEKGIDGFFKYVTQGRQMYRRAENQRINTEDQIRVLTERQERMERYGNFKEEQMCKIQIMQITQPEIVLELLKDQYATTGISDRKELKREITKYEETIRQKTKYSPILDYYKGLHYNLREVLMGYFYKDKTSENPLRYLQTNKGSIKLDYEHIRLLEILYTEKDRIGQKILRAVKIYLALETYYSEVLDLKNKVQTIGIDGDVKGNLEVFFGTNPDNFNAGKIHQYTRGYMSKVTQPKNTRCYEIKPSNLNRRSLKMSMGIEELEYSELPKLYKEAIQQLEKEKGSMVYKGLSVEQEEMMIPTLLNEDFMYRDGVLKESIDREYTVRYQKYSKNIERQGVLSNIYNRVVQPYSVDIIGSIVLKLLKYLEAYKEDVWIYYISAEKICIAINEDLDEGYDKEILQDVWGISSRVGEVTYKSIIEGLK